MLPAKDILAVIREYDNSKESVVNLLVTPEQFARAVVIEKQYKDLTRTHLRGMMNAIIFREDADPLEFLTAIGDLEGGSEALADYFTEKWDRIEAFASNGSFDTMRGHRRAAVQDRPAGRGLRAAACRAGRDCRPRLDGTGLAAALPEPGPVHRDADRAAGQGARARPGRWATTRTLEDEDDGKVETGDTDRGQATPAARESDEESAI